MTTSSATTSIAGSPEVILTARDIPGALALSTEAGWNQLEGDWQRLVRLWPNGCFCIRDGGEVISTTVAVTYDRRLAWIAMVLTKVERRGQGLARRLLEQSLAYTDSLGMECVKLDATDLGRPVYEKLGFVDERKVSRWLRRKSPSVNRPPRTEKYLDSELMQMDRKAFGANRTRLLEDLSELNHVYALPGQGYAICRPGRTAVHFGPCVAETNYDAKEILSAALNRHGREDMIWDLADENEGAVRLAMEAGFSRIRKLTRMRRGGDAALAFSPKIYALAGFELG